MGQLTTDSSLWAQLALDYKNLIPCLFCSSFGSLVRLLVKGCRLTLREALRDVIIGAFACTLTFFMLYDRVGQALLFFFALTSGFLSYEFLSLTSKLVMDVMTNYLEKLKNMLTNK